MNMQVLDARREVSGGYKVDVTRGERIGRVSSEWFSRPDDEHFHPHHHLSAIAASSRSASVHDAPSGYGQGHVDFPERLRPCCEHIGTQHCDVGP